MGILQDGRIRKCTAGALPKFASLCISSLQGVQLWTEGLRACNLQNPQADACFCPHEHVQTEALGGKHHIVVCETLYMIWECWSTL